MDATNMTFLDNTFDLTFDKGTLDALLCSKNNDIPFKLIQEMYRVTKINSHFAFVTYGKPEERLKVFREALPQDKYNFSHQVREISLSLMSNIKISGPKSHCMRSRKP